MHRPRPGPTVSRPPAIFSPLRHHDDAEPAAERSRRTSVCDKQRAFLPFPCLSFSFPCHLSNSLPHSSPRPQCPPAWFDPPPSEPAAPVCAAARARPSACTKTAARPARTAQKACTNAICLRRAWPITTARAQRANPQRIAQRARLCRRPGPVPLTPGSPLWAQAEPDTYRPRPKSECFCFLVRAHPLPIFAFMHAARLFAANPQHLFCSFSLKPCLSDCSVCLQPCKSREHPSEPLHPLWAQRRHVPPLSSVQPPPPPRFVVPEWPGRPCSSRTRCCTAPSYAAAICPFPIHSPTRPFPFGCQTARFVSIFFFFFFFAAAALCALVAAVRSLKPPEPERNPLTRSCCQAYTGTRRRVRARRVKDIPSLRGLSQADVYATAEKCFARI